MRMIMGSVTGGIFTIGFGLLGVGRILDEGSCGDRPSP